MLASTRRWGTSIVAPRQPGFYIAHDTWSRENPVLLSPFAEMLVQPEPYLGRCSIESSSSRTSPDVAVDDKRELIRQVTLGDTSDFVVNRSFGVLLCRKDVSWNGRSALRPSGPQVRAGCRTGMNRGDRKTGRVRQTVSDNQLCCPRCFRPPPGTRDFDHSPENSMHEDRDAGASRRHLLRCSRMAQSSFGRPLRTWRHP